MDLSDENMEKLLKDNMHVFEMKSKMAEACNNQGMDDIESALIMFISDMYTSTLDENESMNRSAAFCARVIMVLKTLYSMNVNQEKKTLQ